MEDLKYDEELDFNNSVYKPDSWTYGDYLEVCDREHSQSSSDNWDKVISKLTEVRDSVNEDVRYWMKGIDTDLAYENRSVKKSYLKAKTPMVVERGEEPKESTLGIDYVYKDYIPSWYAFDVSGDLIHLGDFKTEDEAFIKASEVELELNEPIHDVHKEYS
jgi:hypothetical protein